MHLLQYIIIIIGTHIGIIMCVKKIKSFQIGETIKITIWCTDIVYVKNVVKKICSLVIKQISTGRLLEKKYAM